MTKEEIEEYKKIAKAGDRFVYNPFGGPIYNNPTVYHVHEVYERGPTFSIQKTKRDHYCLMEWNWLGKYQLVYKEP